MPQVAAVADLDGLVGLAAEVEALAAAWGLPGSTSFALQLCLEEAVSNALRHGHLPPGGLVEIAFRRAGDAVVVEISDPGVAFDPLAAPPPPPLDDVATAVVGGRGIALMRSFCPDIAYRRSGGRNHLRLTFPRDPA